MDAVGARAPLCSGLFVKSKENGEKGKGSQELHNNIWQSLSVCLVLRLI